MIYKYTTRSNAKMKSLFEIEDKEGISDTNTNYILYILCYLFYYLRFYKFSLVLLFILIFLYLHSFLNLT